ncbi:protein Son isoform X2 [Planococcus citri]|uniref:protein Son isoform X2 n=1 Tax=Planococcus citri TaxID=170843 RepID=UPI0031F8E374
MTAEVKSSDEILQELFGMCKQKSIDSSEQSSHSQSESDVDDDASATKKHKKKKKKKHKKHKKRGRSSSDESDSSDRKSHKRKKKKSHKDDDRSKKLKVKIKTEPGEPPLPYDELVGIEKRDKVTDTATGKKMTIDDVFNSLGIAPKTRIKVEKGLSPVHVKKENGCDVKPNLIPEGPALPVPPPTPAPAPCPPASSSDKAPLKVEKDADTNPNSSNKTNLSDVFDAEPTLLADKSNSKTKKINIDNLKHSSVYEATIKEVEERERKKAEKYEEGELSSSSSSSQDELSNDDDLQQESETDSKKKEKRRHKHKHRSKSKDHERSKSKHRSRSHHRKHSHEKTSHKEKDKDKDKDKEHKSRKSSVSPSRHSRSSKSYYDHHHHSAHHRPYHYSSYYSRASSVEGRGSSRSHTSREEKRGTSNDRIHSRIRGKITSKERSTRSKSSEKIDKQKLLEIARKNAITLLKQGALPASVVVNTKDKIASIKAGGKTVDELTDFCKQLSKKEALGQESLSSGSDLDEEREKAFHHPFQLKERPSSIVMNIRNAVPLPTKTAQEKTLELSKQLSLQYPVSSGQHHSTYESEWVPVEKTPDPPAVPAVVPPPQKITGSEPSYALNYPLVSYPTVNYNGYSNKIPLPQAPSADIGSIVAERLEAIRRLTENPSDPIGNDLIQVAENKMKVWAESKVQPGLFTGSTGVRTLSAAELSSGFKAWPKKVIKDSQAPALFNSFVSTILYGITIQLGLSP